MRNFVIAYVAAALTMVALDLIWLSQMMEPLYKPAIGPLLADQPNMTAAVAFYVLYLAGVVYLAVWPALQSGHWSGAILRGAVFGLVAYATYDLTNMATLKMWSLRVTLMDMAWGSVLTATTAGVGAFATTLFGKLP